MSEGARMFWGGLAVGIVVTLLLFFGFGWLITRVAENASRQTFAQAVKDMNESSRNSLMPGQGMKFVVAYKDKEGLKIIPKMFDTVELALKEVPADAQGEIRVMTLKLEK